MQPLWKVGRQHPTHFSVPESPTRTHAPHETLVRQRGGDKGSACVEGWGLIWTPGAAALGWAALGPGWVLARVLSFADAEIRTVVLPFWCLS